SAPTRSSIRTVRWSAASRRSGRLTTDGNSNIPAGSAGRGQPILLQPPFEAALSVALLVGSRLERRLQPGLAAHIIDNIIAPDIEFRELSEGLKSMRPRFPYSLALLLTLLSTAVFSQQITGSIFGSVRDSSGAAVATARVKLISATTGAERE